MAVLKHIALAASLLTSFVAAVPLGNAPRAVRVFTHTETAWVTVEETAIVWVTAGQPTPVVEAPTTAVAVAITSSTVTTPPAVTPTPTTTSIPTTTETPVQIAAAVPTTLVTSAVPTSSAAPPPVNIQAKSDASAAATCEGSGAQCLGDVTHWDGGLGACGWNVDTNSENVISLPHAFMGTQSNGNPYCGRSVTLFNPTSGTTVQATVGDKCMGCEGRAIDCTNKLFAEITDGKGDGRMSGIQWYFNA